MLSSADLHLERALFLVALLIFFGAGFLCMLIAFIINSVQEKKKNGFYYFRVFLISGITILGLSAAFFCMLFIG